MELIAFREKPDNFRESVRSKLSLAQPGQPVRGTPSYSPSLFPMRLAAPLTGDRGTMKRFFFNLRGAENTDDPFGLVYAGELEAFRAAQRLADDLSKARPNLHGNTCVAVARRDADDLYLVSI